MLVEFFIQVLLLYSSHSSSLRSTSNVKAVAQQLVLDPSLHKMILALLYWSQRPYIMALVSIIPEEAFHFLWFTVLFAQSAAPSFAQKLKLPFDLPTTPGENAKRQWRVGSSQSSLQRATLTHYFRRPFSLVLSSVSSLTIFLSHSTWLQEAARSVNLWGARIEARLGV
ncbi:unnamed protein product, partial [Chrysoparadoxa australica]